MAKLTLTDISAGYTSTSTINANNALIEAALENTLSRDGTSPNTMSANLDLNSNKVVNVTDPTDNQDASTKKYVDDLVASSVDGQISGSFSVGTAWDWTAQQDFTAGIRIVDSGETDSVELAHDGTDLNVNATNTTDININDGLVLKIHDADESDFVSISHDGSDAQFSGIDAGRFFDFTDSAGDPGNITAGNVIFSAASLADSGVIWGNSAGDDSMSMTVTGDAVNVTVNTGVMSQMSFGGGIFPVNLDGNDLSTLRQWKGLHMIEQSDHPIAPAATYGQIWVNDESTQDLMFTNDAGTDEYLTTQTKYKTADESVSASTTLQDDNHLTGFSVVANGVYLLEGYLDYTQNVGDIKLQLTYTASPSKRSYSVFAVAEDGTTDEDTDNAGNALALTGLTDGQDVGATFRGHLTMGGTGGTMKVQWAQNTSDANNTTLREGSWLRLQRIA